MTSQTVAKRPIPARAMNSGMVSLLPGTVLRVSESLLVGGVRCRIIYTPDEAKYFASAAAYRKAMR